MYGNLGFGFSPQLWAETENLIDLERAQPYSDFYPMPTTGYVVVQHDFGTYTETSGLIPDYIALGEADNQFLAMLPASSRNVIIAEVSSGMDLGDAVNRLLGPMQWQNPTLFNKLSPYYLAVFQQGQAFQLELWAFRGMPGL
jgi:hypothetical protein